MDFIDWCHYILQVLDREKFNSNLTDHSLPRLVFGKDVTGKDDFHGSSARLGVFDALRLLSNAGLADKGKFDWKITPRGRKVLSSSTEFWSETCKEDLDPDEEKILHLVNQTSPQQGTNPDCAWLEDVERDTVLGAFNIEPPPIKSNDQRDQIQKYLYDLPKLLEDRGFLKTRVRGGYGNSLTPTYRGLVWGTRRGFTIESKFIDELVKEWETTNVDFKREIYLDTKKQKAEFAKDVLGLANTKSSGRRFLIVGFDDKTRGYHTPPDERATQERMERILSDLTDPVVNIRYEIVDYRLGKVGKLEVIREPEKLPYKAAKDLVIDEKGRKGLEKDKIYVRHGSQTESPTETELQALKDEGIRARSE